MQNLSKEEISSIYQQLKNSNKPSARGYTLEKLISAVLTNENLEPRTSYRPRGEEIDGSFYWHGQTFLLEAKWHGKPIPVSIIYSFKGKLDGKFHTTSGIFISLSGYSSEAQDALRFGKTLNIIFFDGEDMDLVLSGSVRFTDVLKFKIRQAGDTGVIYVPFTIRANAKSIENETTFLSERGMRLRNRTAKDILVFVEGKNDIHAARALLKPLEDRYLIAYGIVTMNGLNAVKNLPALLNVYGTKSKLKGAIILLDDDAKSFEGILISVSEQAEKAANPIKMIWQYLSTEVKTRLQDKNLTIDELEEYDVFTALDLFIDEVLYEERDPLKYIPKAAIEGTLASFIWDKTNKVVRLESNDEHRPYIEMNSIQELVSCVEDEICSALENELPPMILGDASNWDYSWQIREFISAHYLKNIKSIGWDPNDV
jgi:hypothetical protein